VTSHPLGGGPPSGRDRKPVVAGGGGAALPGRKRYGNHTHTHHAAHTPCFCQSLATVPQHHPPPAISGASQPNPLPRNAHGKMLPQVEEPALNTHPPRLEGGSRPDINLRPLFGQQQVPPPPARLRPRLQVCALACGAGALSLEWHEELTFPHLQSNQRLGY